MTSRQEESLGVDEFSSAREQFELLVNELHLEKNQSLQHGDVEALIDCQGREILRHLFQAYFDLKASKEKKKIASKGQIEWCDHIADSAVSAD